MRRKEMHPLQLLGICVIFSVFVTIPLIYAQGIWKIILIIFYILAGLGIWADWRKDEERRKWWNDGKDEDDTGNDKKGVV